jgi:hypothetical protein
VFVYYYQNVSHRPLVHLLPKPWAHMPFESLIDHVVVLMLTLFLGKIFSFVRPHSLKSHLISLYNADSSLCIYSLTALAFLALPNILASTSRSLANFLGVGVFFKLAIHLSTLSLIEAYSFTLVFSYDRIGRRILNGDELIFFLRQLGSLRL